MRDTTTLTRPPAGALTGDTVPRENEADERDRLSTERVAALLKQRGEPYTSMSETELTHRARRISEGE